MGEASDQISNLLYVASYWHALAKMRMHTDSSLALLEATTTILGQELRQFALVTCAAFNTRETQSEYEARKRAEERRTRGVAANPSASVPPSASATPSGQQAGGVPAVAGRRPRQYNLKTIKLHFLGDYTASIRQFGTTDSWTTQIVSKHAHYKMTVTADFYLARASTSTAW